MLDDQQRSTSLQQLAERVSSFAMSSKCKPSSFVKDIENAFVVRLAEMPASFRRCASPPESVVADCPRRK